MNACPFSFNFWFAYGSFPLLTFFKLWFHSSFAKFSYILQWFYKVTLNPIFHTINLSEDLSVLFSSGNLCVSGFSPSASVWTSCPLIWSLSCCHGTFPSYQRFSLPLSLLDFSYMCDGSWNFIRLEKSQVQWGAIQDGVPGKHMCVQGVRV